MAFIKFFGTIYRINCFHSSPQNNFSEDSEKYIEE